MLTGAHPAFAWGDEGHEVIALIAEHYLDQAARAKIATLLAADTNTLTGHDIASKATWADKYRDSDRDTTKIRSTRSAAASPNLRARRADFHRSRM